MHDGETLDEFGSKVMGAIETELYELTAHQCMVGERSRSRADGPALVWRQLQEQATSRYSRGNPLVHAWAAVASWLRTMLTSKSLPRKRSARWRLLHLAMPVDLLDPCPKMQQTVVDFKAWRARLHLAPLEGTHLIKSLYVQSLQFPRATSELADRAASVRFAQHLQDGPAKGLKHQHRLSRCAVGWIPAAVAETEPGEFDMELDDADSLGVAAAAQSQFGLRAPLSMQQAAEAERERWSIEWGADQHFAQPAWEHSDFVVAPPPLVMEQFIRSLLPSRVARAWGGMPCTLEPW